MPIQETQILANLSEIRLEDLQLLYKKTLNAIFAIVFSYVAGILFFVVLFLLNSDYWYMAFVFPLMGYLWLISFGAKYVNNHYGLKKAPDGTLVYLKKRKSYSTFIAIHALIFLVLSIVRVINEINHLLLIKQELNKSKINVTA